MSNNFIAFSLASMFVSSLPVPDSIRLSLEAESKKWFVWLLISGAVVALGCILEIPETRFSLMQWWREKRGHASKKENPANWSIPAASIGLLLVIIGVVGEVVFEGLAYYADAKLIAHESEVLSTAETKASTAYARAADAEVRAGNLEKDAKGFELQIAQANERAAEAEKLTAETQKGAEQLRKDAETERLARIRLEAKVAWRTVTPDQLTILKQQLQSVRGRAITVIWTTLDPEQASFGKQLADALTNSGLSVSTVSVGLSSEMENNTAPISFADVEDLDLVQTVATALVAASLAKPPIRATPPGSIIIGGNALKLVIGPRAPI